MTATTLPSNLTSQEKAYLRQLGLSKHAITLYVLLLKHGQLTAKRAGELSEGFAAAEYRLFGLLESYGLARRQAGRPVSFVAVAKELGLKAAYLHSRGELERLAAGLGMTNGGPTRLELVIGRQAQYKRYAELAGQAHQEICIYAIGIAYSRELLAVQRAALARGVRIRHVVQQVKPSNFHVVHRWQRLGVRLRYEQAERGFHLMVFDGQVALVTFSDPTNTDDRLSILTENETAVRLLAAYFQDIWLQAREIDL